VAMLDLKFGHECLDKNSDNSFVSSGWNQAFNG